LLCSAISYPGSINALFSKLLPLLHYCTVQQIRTLAALLFCSGNSSPWQH